MVPVFGFTVTPRGKFPTGTVAVTAMQPFAPWAVPGAEDAGAALAMVVATGASAVTAAPITHAVHRVNLMMSCPPCPALSVPISKPTGTPGTHMTAPGRWLGLHDEP